MLKKGLKNGPKLDVYACTYPFQMALWAGFRANFGASLQAEKSYLIATLAALHGQSLWEQCTVGKIRVKNYDGLFYDTQRYLRKLTIASSAACRGDWQNHPHQHPKKLINSLSLWERRKIYARFSQPCIAPSGTVHDTCVATEPGPFAGHPARVPERQGAAGPSRQDHHGGQQAGALQPSRGDQGERSQVLKGGCLDRETDVGWDNNYRIKHAH